MKFILPQKIESIISILQIAGYSAHVVGGCVRDMLTGREPKDWDITTNALPEQMKGLFSKTYDTGIKHGTVTVSYEGVQAEITAWRTEGIYTDHRRPDEVVFTNSLIEDLSRRDFTMNAIAYNTRDGLVDPFSGFGDIKNHIIRSVGDPYKRFSEDALRMLRAVRFSAQLGFIIDKPTYDAICTLHTDLAYVSMERIHVELDKLLESENPERLSLLWETGLSRVIFPQIPDYPGDLDQIFSYQKTASDKKAVYLAALFYLGCKSAPIDEAVEALRRLKYDNQTITTVTLILRGLGNHHAYSERNSRRITVELGDKIASDVLNLTALINKKSTLPNKMDTLIDRPALSGQDLQQSGLCFGKEIGVMLYLLSLCLYERPELNDRETLLNLAQVIKQKFPLL